SVHVVADLGDEIASCVPTRGADRQRFAGQRGVGLDDPRCGACVGRDRTEQLGERGVALHGPEQNTWGSTTVSVGMSNATSSHTGDVTWWPSPTPSAVFE